MQLILRWLYDLWELIEDMLTLYSVVTILITIFGVTSYVKSAKKEGKKRKFQWQLGIALILIVVSVASMCVHRFASKVPGVTNTYFEYAIGEIKRAGLEYAVNSNKNGATGIILDQNPAEGVIVKKSTVVTLDLDEMSNGTGKEGILTTIETPAPRLTETPTPKPTDMPTPTSMTIPTLTPMESPTLAPTSTSMPKPTNTPIPLIQKIVAGGVKPFATSNPKSDGIVNVRLNSWEENDRDIFGFTYKFAYKLSVSHVVYAVAGGYGKITAEVHIPFGERCKGSCFISFVVAEEMAGNGSYADVTILSGDEELEGPFRIESTTTDELLYEIDVTGVRNLIIRFECSVTDNGFISGIVIQ